MLARFNSLSTLLIKHQLIWKTPIFQITDFSYLSEHEVALNFLLRLSETEVEALQADDQTLLSRISPYFPDALTLAEDIAFPAAFTDAAFAAPKFWDTDVPGRKAQQLLAFSAALGEIDNALLEWCCGKQHLGRLLAEVHQQPAIGLDIDSSLIAQAKTLTEKRQLHTLVKSACCDVLSRQAEVFMHAEQHLLALHACGGLHTRMLQLGAAKASARISFSPCCYHRFLDSPNYQPLSEAGQRSGLSLSRDELRLAVRETQTASKSETLKRKTLQIWRLGFDCLQRDVSGVDQYLPTPSLNSKILQEDFQAFCAHLAQLKGLKLKTDLNFSAYLEQGQSRFQLYQRMELFRMVFRRALECWLVLDKALFLEEQGYICEISRFCAPEISPRNLLVQAFRQ